MIKRLLRRFLMLVAFAVVAVILMSGRFLVEGGLFHRIEPHFAGTCASVDLGGVTVRDIAIEPATGIAYLATSATDPAEAIRRIDLKAETPALSPAQLIPPHDFTAEALSLFADADSKRLHVVSHPAGERYTVEMFDPTAEGGWTHSSSLHDTRFRAPADLVAVGPNQFYLANRAEDSVLRRLGEMLLARGAALTIYYGGEKSITVTQDLPGAGGIAVSPNGTVVYIAETQAREIRVYTREPFTGLLTPDATIKVPGAPYHLDVTPDGTLWVAADPRFTGAADKNAPSQILRIATPATAPRVEEIYAETPDHFAAARTVAAFGTTLVIGSPVESRLQICQMVARTQ